MFDITKEEIEEVKNNFLISEKPLVLKVFPAREKKKYIVATLIIELFDVGKEYRESEVNDILVNIHDDYATIRRFLVDNKFLYRDRLGTRYIKTIG